MIRHLLTAPENSVSCSASSQLNFIAMSLVPFSPQAPRTVIRGPDPATWTRHWQPITRLYIHENESLEDIMEFMARTYNFHTTKRMFKFRIKGWKLNKSFRPKEALAMARVKARRETTGKGAGFWRYGRPVTPAKLERYFCNHPHTAAQLKKYALEDVFAKGHIEALLPAHIVGLTPSRALKLDKDMHSLEDLMASLNYYLKNGCFDHHSDLNYSSAGLWTQDGLRLGLDGALDILEQSQSQTRYRKVANSILQSEFDALRSTVDIEHPVLIWGILYLYTKAYFVSHRPEIAIL
ncbi:Clr5 domain-containing protein [Dactylonectria estremocensis]|uniref:Clr5 domain-containing protein n=1 Tax=Dactylonectria estremocensis TaxID=1079267 RepID=A0A9P9DWF3_9HYPO|nr:Clr5 domain-containing protein [Dactylonectria estremocensis]